MSLIKAIDSGLTNSASVWEEGIFPSASDDIDLQGFWVTQVGPLSYNSLVNGFFTVTDDFTCPLITNATIVCNTHKLDIAIPILAATAGLDGTFKIDGPHTNTFCAGVMFEVSGSDAGNNGSYIVKSSSVVDGDTIITVANDVPNFEDYPYSGFQLERWIPLEMVSGFTPGGGIYKTMGDDWYNAAIALFENSYIDLVGDVSLSGDARYGLKTIESGTNIWSWTGDNNNSSEFGIGLYLETDTYLKRWIGNNNNSSEIGYGIYLGGTIDTWTGLELSTINEIYDAGGTILHHISSNRRRRLLCGV